MDDTYRKQIVIKSLIVLAAMAAVTLLVWPVWSLYALIGTWAGLAAGTVASLLAFLIMVAGADKSVSRGNRMISVFAYIFRVMIYAAAIIPMTLLFGNAGCLGAGLGLLTWIGAVIWHNALIPIMQARRVKNRGYAYVEFPRNSRGESRYLLIRSYSLDMWQGGRHFVTHRKFRLLVGSEASASDTGSKGGK